MVLEELSGTQRAASHLGSQQTGWELALQVVEEWEK